VLTKNQYGVPRLPRGKTIGSTGHPGAIGNDRIYGNNIGEMDVLIAEGETEEGVDERGNLLSGRNGNDFVYGSNRNDALFGGIVKSFLLA